MEKENFNFAFFGTSEFSVGVLEALKKKGLSPSLIITVPDAPKGRKLVLTPPPVKVWAQENNIKYVQPQSLKSPDFLHLLLTTYYQLFIVASYGKIIPASIFEMPIHKTLNVHPSLLPYLRGASPIQGAILGESETGVTIMQIDSEMDHGPIIAQEKVHIEQWPTRADTLENILAQKGGELLADVLPKWIAGKITAKEQAHSKATYTQLIKKEDGLIEIEKNPEKNWRKFLAYVKWPGVYFFTEKNGKKNRVIIKDAVYSEEKFLITRVLPEGGKEMSYDDFLQRKRS